MFIFIYFCYLFNCRLQLTQYCQCPSKGKLTAVEKLQYYHHPVDSDKFFKIFIMLCSVLFIFVTYLSGRYSQFI